MALGVDTVFPPGLYLDCARLNLTHHFVEILSASLVQDDVALFISDAVDDIRVLLDDGLAVANDRRNAIAAIRPVDLNAFQFG